VTVCDQLPFVRKPFKRLPFKYRFIAVYVIEHLRIADHIAGIDQRAVACGFFAEAVNQVVPIGSDDAETGSDVDGGHRQQFSVFLMKPHRIRNVHIAYSVAVGEQKGFVADILLHPFDSAARHRIQPRFRKRHAPRLRAVPMISIFVRFQIDRDIGLI